MMSTRLDYAEAAPAAYDAMSSLERYMRGGQLRAGSAGLKNCVHCASPNTRI